MKTMPTTTTTTTTTTTAARFSHTRVARVAAVLALLATAAPAHAESENAAMARLERESGQTNSASRLHVLRVDLGAFSPLGFFGVAYAYAPTGVFQLEVGAGAGLTGLQLSVMPKLTAGSEQHKFVLGAGASVGLGNHEFLDADAVGFLNAELGYQYISRSGFTFSAGAGITVALNGRHKTYDGSRTDAVGPYPMFRVGFGKAF